jgi:branched-subunit amino acid permease
VNKHTPDSVFKGGALGAFSISASVLALKHGIKIFSFVEILPFHRFDLGWVGPAFVGAILGYFYAASNREREE